MPCIPRRAAAATEPPAAGSERHAHHPQGAEAIRRRPLHVLRRQPGRPRGRASRLRQRRR